MKCQRARKTKKKVFSDCGFKETKQNKKQALEMTVYHLLTLNYQTIPPSTHLKRERALKNLSQRTASGRHYMLCFRLPLSKNPIQVRTEYKPSIKPYKVFCVNPLAIFCTSSYQSQTSGQRRRKRKE